MQKHVQAGTLILMLFRRQRATYCVYAAPSRVQRHARNEMSAEGEAARDAQPTSSHRLIGQSACRVATARDGALRAGQQLSKKSRFCGEDALRALCVVMMASLGQM